MSLKLVHISDTHLQPFPELPEADVLVHSGDGLNYGSLTELERFKEQLMAVAPKYGKIFYCPGNHDKVLEHTPYSSINFLKKDIPNLEVGIHDAFEYKGYKWFSTSYQPFFCNWSFNVKDNLDLYEKYLQIPKETEILITHAPAKGTLDYVVNTFNPNGAHVGSKALQMAIEQLPNLKLVMSGHIHYAAGQTEKNGVKYSNAAICNEAYKPVNKAQLIELE